MPQVDAVLASPYVRAWQTAELMRDEAGWPKPESCAELAAHRPADAALAPLQRHAQRDAVALVGHEPNLSSLASLLLAGDEGSFGLELKKGGVIALGFGAAPAPGAGLLLWSVAPKILRALSR